MDSCGAAENAREDAFTLTLPKGDGMPLGLNLSHPVLEHALVVEEVKPEGAVAAWTRRCASPDRTLKRGDRIVSVNGVSGSQELMLQELQQCRYKTLVTMKVCRDEHIVMRADCPRPGAVAEPMRGEMDVLVHERASACEALEEPLTSFNAVFIAGEKVGSSATGSADMMEASHVASAFRVATAPVWADVVDSDSVSGYFDAFGVKAAERVAAVDVTNHWKECEAAAADAAVTAEALGITPAEWSEALALGITPAQWYEFLASLPPTA